MSEWRDNPWCWQAVGEKDNRWCLGLAWNSDDQPLEGEITTDEGIVFDLITEGEGDLRIPAHIVEIHNRARAAEPDGLYRCPFHRDQVGTSSDFCRVKVKQVGGGFSECDERYVRVEPDGFREALRANMDDAGHSGGCSDGLGGVECHREHEPTEDADCPDCAPSCNAARRALGVADRQETGE